MLMNSEIRSRRSTATSQRSVARKTKSPRKLSTRHELLTNFVIISAMLFLSFVTIQSSLNRNIVSNVPHTAAFRRAKKYRSRYFPRVVRIVDSKHPTSRVSNFERRKKSQRRIVPRIGNRFRQREVVWNSESYEDLHEFLDEGQGDCKLEHEWQKGYQPQCNSVHETDLASLFDGTGNVRVQYLSNGAYRDVWTVVNEVGEKFVFKPMRWKRDFSFRNMDRMRRDTLVMDRLTGQKYILDIYLACGTSGAFELATGGTITDAIWPKSEKVSPLSPIERLHIATQATMALASVHNIDKEGRPSIAHTDISPDQYLLSDEGYFKLNDFNRARFLRYSEVNNTVCPFYVGKNSGKNRSPEEYAYGPETEKIDVYSLGNIFYMLLQDAFPFDSTDAEDVYKLVMKGVRPKLTESAEWNAQHPVFGALKEALTLSQHQDPSKRATARQIETFLKQKMMDIDPGRLEQWGDV